MTAEESKAKEIMGKYLYQVFSGHFQPSEYSKQLAKTCAIICVDEILNVAKGSHDEDHINWWQMVKTFIQNSS